LLHREHHLEQLPRPKGGREPLASDDSRVGRRAFTARRPRQLREDPLGPPRPVRVQPPRVGGGLHAPERLMPASSSHTDIPVKVKLRPDTGLYNGKLGIWLFLASEVMLFGALFSAFIFQRTLSPEWPPPGTPKLSVGLAMVNTFVLITSS